MNERLIIKPNGYIKQLDPTASDLTVVNGARASFRKHQDNMDSRGEDLIRRLITSGHETPAEQHSLLIWVHDAPCDILNLIPDEIHHNVYNDGKTSFPWNLNFRHAMHLYDRSRNMKKYDGGKCLDYASTIVSKFFNYMPVTVGSFLQSRKTNIDDLTNLVDSVDVVGKATEKNAIELINRCGGPDVEWAYDCAPNLLNLWTFSWQIRAPIHVFWDLVRHRKSSPNGESGRYSKLEWENIELSPDEVRTQMGNPMSYQRGIASSDIANEFINDYRKYNHMGRELYEKHMGRGIARELCSWYQTLGGMRTFVWTFRGCGLLNMLKLRNAPEALKELRLYAAEMESDISRDAPILYDVFRRRGRMVV